MGEGKSVVRAWYVHVHKSKFINQKKRLIKYYYASYFNLLLNVVCEFTKTIKINDKGSKAKENKLCMQSSQ